MKKLFILISFILSLTFSLVGVSCDRSEKPSTEDGLSVYKIKNGDLESGDLTDWSQEGNAFSLFGISDQTLTSNGQNNNKTGIYYFANKFAEEKTGVLISSPFKVGGSGFITFKLGGAMNSGLTYLSVIEKNTGIELFRFGNPLFTEDKSEVLNDYKADLSKAKGKEVVIKITDNSTQNYGFVCFDEIITYYKNEPDGYTLATDIKPINLGIATPSAIINGDFSSGLNGWQTTGEQDCFTIDQIKDGKISNKSNSSSVGVLRSSPFKVSGTGLISYRLGMTEDKNLTYLSVKKCGTNEEIFRTNSNRWKVGHGEDTHLYYMDLSKYLGENIYLEFVDNSRSEWGAMSIKEIKTVYAELPFLTDEVAIDTREEHNVNPTYSEMRSRVNGVINDIQDETLKTTFKNTFYATIDGVSTISGFNPVLRYNQDGTVFCYTGDIHAMWLRDSSAQVLQYLQFINVDSDVKNTVRGLLLKQFEQIRRDPYANAFNEDGSVWERKFELDSLSYPLWLANKYYKLTGETDIFNNFFLITMDRILDTLELERDHSKSSYSVHAADLGKGVNDYTNCGLIWSGYRPSDDVCHYKFFIPGNMFVVAVLEDMVSIFDELGLDAQMKQRMSALASSVRQAIETYGVYNHPTYGKMYAFEVDGSNADINSANGKLLTDMANIPSLISAPWLGYCETTDQTYINTRRFCLSEDNEYYFVGQYASGIGDQHEILNGTNAPWHMGIAMQGLTSTDKTEIERCVEYMTNTTGGKYVMHEAFNADDPTHYSRDYFTWPCSLYSHLVLTEIFNYKLLEV